MRKCVSGMIHGDRDQKERKEKGRRDSGGGGKEAEEEVQEGTPETKGRN